MQGTPAGSGAMSPDEHAIASSLGYRAGHRRRSPHCWTTWRRPTPAAPEATAQRAEAMLICSAKVPRGRRGDRRTVRVPLRHEPLAHVHREHLPRNTLPRLEPTSLMAPTIRRPGCTPSGRPRPRLPGRCVGEAGSWECLCCGVVLPQRSDTDGLRSDE